MIKKLPLFIISLLFVQSIFGQSFNYTTSTGNLGTTYSWIDCSSGTEVQDADWLQNVGLGDEKDDGYTEINWPFNFQFYDSYYFANEKMYFCTNGFIRFDDVADDDATNTYNNDISGYSPNLGEIVAFALEDAGLENSISTVHYLTTGSAPNRVFTIEVQELEVRFNQNKYMDVQISFYETSNKIVIKVGSFDVSSSYTTYLGIHSGNSTYKHQWGELQTIGQNKWIEYTPPAKSYSNIIITQASTDSVYPSDDNKLVRIQFDINGGGGAFNFTRLAVKEVNDNNADVSNVKIFHTKDATFSTDHQVATTQTSVNNYNNYIFDNFTYDMPGGTSYIWVAYSVASGAINGNNIGARFKSGKIELNGSTYPSSNTSKFTRTIDFVGWNGSTSTDWNVVSNWSNNALPTSSDNVVIPSAPTNQPHLLSGNNGYCNDLTINSGATVTVDNTGALDVYGDINNSGAIACSSAAVKLNGSDNTIKGNGTFTSARFSITSSKKYTLADNLSCTSFEVLSSGELVVNDKDLICSGDLNMNSGSTLTLTDGSVASAGTVTLAGTYTSGKSTFYYSGNNSQTIYFKDYYNLKIKVSSGTRTLSNVATNCKSIELVGAGTANLASVIDIDDNFYIESGVTLSMESYDINISGDWTNNGTLSGSQTITIDGSGTSKINGATIFYNLTLNKSTGDIYMNGTNHITGTLALTKGIVTSGSSTAIIVDAGATTTGGGTTSYVDGPLRKDGNTAYTFHVGDFRKYAPCAIGVPSASTQFIAEYTKAGHADNTSFNSPLTKVSLNEYWNITPSTAVTADVTLYWEDGSWSGIGNLGDLRLAHYNGSSWDELNGATTSGNTSSGSIVKTGVSSFSPFTFGTTDNTTNPLPVSLVSFEAQKVDNSALLEWKTASEINNDYFIIQRSIDGINIEDIATIKGNGNSNTLISYSYSDNNPPSGYVYYRLKQLDFDGKSETFNWRVLNFSNKNSINIYPNPNISGLLYITSSMEGSAIMEIYSVDGKLVLTTDLDFNAGETSLNHNLNKGYYFIKIHQNNSITTQKFIVQ